MMSALVELMVMFEMDMIWKRTALVEQQVAAWLRYVEVTAVAADLQIAVVEDQTAS